MKRKPYPLLLPEGMSLVESDGHNQWRLYSGHGRVVFLPAEFDRDRGAVGAELGEVVYLAADPSTLWAAVMLGRHHDQVDPRQVDLCETDINGKLLYEVLYREYQNLREEVVGDLHSGESSLGISINMRKVPAAVPIQLVLEEALKPASWKLATDIKYVFPDDDRPAFEVRDSKEYQDPRYLYILVREWIERALRVRTLPVGWYDRYPPDVSKYLFGEIIDLAEGEMEISAAQDLNTAANAAVK